MNPFTRHKCSICKRMTTRWEKANGGPYRCYDGCYGTTGKDRRTVDGKPQWLQNKKETV